MAAGLNGWTRLVASTVVLTLAGGCAASGPSLGGLPGIVQVAGHPFSALALEDGTLLVSVSRDGGGAIEILRPKADAFVPGGSFPVEGRPASLALSHDGRLVAVAADRSTLVLDRARLVSGQPEPVVARVGSQAGAIEVAFSADDRLLAVSEEDAGRVMLLPLKDGGGPTGIDVGRAPVGLAFSPDGRWLYALSEAGGGGAGRCTGSSGASVEPGTVSTIEVGKGAPPRLAATASIGCGPVRIVLSADGSQAFVSLRGEDRVGAFRAEELRAGRAAPVAAVAVGAAPVGLSLSADGRHLWVANSNRFKPDQPGSLGCLDIEPDGGLARVRDVPAGRFPRELARLPDGRVVATLFRDDAVQVVRAGPGC